MAAFTYKYNTNTPAAGNYATSARVGRSMLRGVIAFCGQGTNARYLKIFDKASAPTVGTDVPVLVINCGIPTGGSFSTIFPTPIQFQLGVALAAVDAATDAATGAVNNNEVNAILIFEDC